jgi:hypothetical protein
MSILNSCTRVAQMVMELDIEQMNQDGKKSENQSTASGK